MKTKKIDGFLKWFMGNNDAQKLSEKMLTQTIIFVVSCLIVYFSGDAKYIALVPVLTIILNYFKHY
jgi:hypothetical protein